MGSLQPGAAGAGGSGCGAGCGAGSIARSCYGASRSARTKRNGVDVFRGTVTVASTEEDKPHTVSRDNGTHNWHVDCHGEMLGETIGIPQEKITV